MTARARSAPGRVMRLVLAVVLCAGLSPHAALAGALDGSQKASVSVQAKDGDDGKGVSKPSSSSESEKGGDGESASSSSMGNGKGEDDPKGSSSSESSSGKADDDEDGQKGGSSSSGAGGASKGASEEGEGSKGSSGSGDENGKSSSSSSEGGRSDPKDPSGEAGGKGPSSSSESGEADSKEPSGTGEKDDPKEPADPPKPETPTLDLLYLFYENYEKPDRPLAYSVAANPLITEAQGTMQLYAQSEFSNGNIDWVSSAGVAVVWSIEKTYDEDGVETDEQIARIERGEGVVHALGQGNGRIVARCQASNYDVHADMEISIRGNAGVPYITDLQICDEDGAVYENDAEIRVESGGFGLEKRFHVRASYHDPVSGEDFVRETRNGDTVDGVIWTTSGDANVAYVNADSGVFIARAAGSVRLTCSVPGAGQLGDTITDYVFVLCGGDALDPDRDYNPADELKVVVKYATEDKQGIGGEGDYETARTWYYSPEDLEGLGVTENLYTLVMASGNWGTMKARGVYFERLIEDVINSDDFSLSMVKGFYFGATDNYNPGFVGASWLFDNQRYYYPNMSIGSGNLGAVGVAPMIATQTVQENLVDVPTGELSYQTRFRLCMGAESTTTNNARQSIYNVYQITVILNGAPPVGWDEPANGSGTAHAEDGRKAEDGKPEPGDDPERQQEEGRQPRQPEQPPVDEADQPKPEQDSEEEEPKEEEPPHVVIEAEAPTAVEPHAGKLDASAANPHAVDSTRGDDAAEGAGRDDELGVAAGTDELDAEPVSGGVDVHERESGDPAMQTAAQAVEESSSDRDASAAEGGKPSEAGDRDDIGEADPADNAGHDADDSEAGRSGNEQPAAGAEAAIEAFAGDRQRRWQVYEMMSSQPALLEALSLENPLAPFVAPLLALTALAGGAYSGVWFRREMRTPTRQVQARDGGCR